MLAQAKMMMSKMVAGLDLLRQQHRRRHRRCSSLVAITILAVVSIVLLLNIVLERNETRSLLRWTLLPTTTTTKTTASKSSRVCSGSASSNSSCTPATDTCIPPKPLRWEWNYYSDDNSDDENSSNISRTLTPPTLPSPSSSNSTLPTRNLTKRRNKHKNTLIALFCGYDQYSEMLEKTAPVSKAYGKLWKQDVVVLQGTSYMLSDVDGNCTPPGRRTTLNKITLARVAYTVSFLQHQNDTEGRQQHHHEPYDQILILDTDAMIYNFDVDISTLFPDDDSFMLAAHRVDHQQTTTKHDDDSSTSNDTTSSTTDTVHNDDDDENENENDDTDNDSNFNAGVLLWNLRHPETASVFAEWGYRANTAIRDGTLQGDQRLLHQTLRRPIKNNPQQQQQQGQQTTTTSSSSKSKGVSVSSGGSSRLSRLVTSPRPKDAFAYGHGSVIRHFIRRPDHQTWDDPAKQVEARNDKIDSATQDVCRLYLGFKNLADCWNQAFEYVPYSNF
jgi:hypothetical protein